MKVVNFKIWNEESGHMLHVGKIQFDQFGVSEVESDGMGIQNVFNAETPLTQDTNVRDSRTGEDIYEGDIVLKKQVSPSDAEQVIRDDPLIGVVRFLEGGWVLDNEISRKCEPLWSESDELTILGNIYENPRFAKAVIKDKDDNVGYKGRGMETDK